MQTVPASRPSVPKTIVYDIYVQLSCHGFSPYRGLVRVCASAVCGVRQSLGILMRNFTNIFSHPMRTSWTYR